MTPPRSLQHEYELYVEREIENYKDSIPRSALLAIGDEAVARLRAQQQTTLTEMVLWEEVDRLIRERIKLPTFRSWSRQHAKRLAEMRRPEHWGLSPSSPLAREVTASGPGGHVLLAGVDDERAAIYSAAHGCTVTAIGDDLDAIERVMHAAECAGLTELVRGCVGDLGRWAPDVALRMVVCSPAAFEGLSPAERAEAIATLQTATLDGGVHLVQTLVAGRTAPSLDELRRRYDGWTVSVESGTGPNEAATFLARKAGRLA